jgi:FdhD protein
VSGVDDAVATEEPLEIRIIHWDGGRQASVRASVTMRTPGNDFELAAGFLYTEGILRGLDEVAGVAYCVDVPSEQQYNVVSVTLRPGATFDASLLSRNFYATSSCGVCGKASIDALHVQGCHVDITADFRVDASVIQSLPGLMQQGQSVFQQTGGLHAAGLFTAAGRLITLREDVGRHNAVDKVIGERFLKRGLPLNDHILMLSGRAGFELVQKAAVAGIPVVASVGAPSSLAVETARSFGITLVGFVRPNSCNVYSGEPRITLNAGDRHGLPVSW